MRRQQVVVERPVRAATSLRVCCGAWALKERITSSNPQPLANYSEAFRVGPLVFAAGQLASDFRTGIAVEARLDPAFPYYGSAIKKQTRYVLNNIKNTLQAAGSSLDRVVKATVMLADMAEWAEMNSVYVTYFKGRLPARSAMGVNGLARGARVEIECIAVV